MKERITMQRLVQEGWIPILTGTLSAGVILSLAHSTSMGYVAAVLLITVYFVLISANFVDASWAVAIKSLQQQAISKLKAIFFVRVLDYRRRNFLSDFISKSNIAHHLIGQPRDALPHRLASRVSRFKSTLMASIGSSTDIDHGGLAEWLKIGKMAFGKLIRSVKSAV